MRCASPVRTFSSMFPSVGADCSCLMSLRADSRKKRKQKVKDIFGEYRDKYLSKTVELQCVTETVLMQVSRLMNPAGLSEVMETGGAGHSRSLLHSVSGREKVRLDPDEPLTLSRSERTLF